MAKILVDYTEKPFNGMKSKRFDAKASAEKWIQENKEKLYWTSIRVENAASSKAKLVVSDNEDLSDYINIEGTLETYFETGMECLGLIIQDHTKKGEPNPNFNPTQPESPSNFKFYSSYDGLHFLGEGDILQIEGQPKFFMMKDRQFAGDDAYRLSFYPQGFSREDLLKLFVPQTTKATIWKEKDKKQFPIKG